MSGVIAATRGKKVQADCVLEPGCLFVTAGCEGAGRSASSFNPEFENACSFMATSRCDIQFGGDFLKRNCAPQDQLILSWDST